ncbi:Type III flagellar switch regulator (C-ring) FliN C-term [Sulfitobacter marinus]|uniref:Type III flagellar switch regulator (C-ring) FliN C-term n=2 Tax=Sulfitobacter marinus TaxID=394264 RepID=A0A1I6Q492_9RHOB|nr:Type III flagellar switch regulator (C-ring) FliN C-term [Sulfitobacter marinus]
MYQSRTVSVLRALRLSMSKVGQDLFELPLAVLGATQDVVGNDACAEVFNEDQLMVLLDGPGGARGAAMVDAAFVGGLIQQQTMGEVQPFNADAPARIMTSTDASLIEPFLNTLLERAAPLPQTEDERRLMAGFKFGAKAQDLRLLMLALEADAYHILRLTLDMAQGSRQGELLFCLPVPKPPPKIAEPSFEEDDDVVPEEGDKTLCENVLSLKADLIVSLTQLQLPIRTVGALEVGQVLELGHVSFSNAQVRTMEGRIVGHGVLGQREGMRAVRVKHRSKQRETPLRRSSDAAALRAEAAQDAQFDDFYSVQDLPALTGQGGDGATKSDADMGFENAPMPDLSDLPGFEDEADGTSEKMDQLNTG